MHNEQGFDWGSLIVGALYLVASFLAFNNPDMGIFSIILLFSIAIIMKGVFELAVNHRMSLATGHGSGWMVFIGIVDIILGLVFLFNFWLGFITLPFLFAFWFFMDSVSRLFLAFKYRETRNGRFWFNLVIGILGIILGILLLFNPFASLITMNYLLAFFFLMSGVAHVVQAF